MKLHPHMLRFMPYIDRLAIVGMAVVLIVFAAVGIGGGVVTDQATSRHGHRPTEYYPG